MRWSEFPTKSKHGRTKYPWREIAEAGKVAALIRGEDFHGDGEAVIGACYQWAKAHQYRAKVRTLRDANGFPAEILIQFTGLGHASGRS